MIRTSRIHSRSRWSVAPRARRPLTIRSSPAIRFRLDARVQRPGRKGAPEGGERRLQIDRLTRAARSASKSSSRPSQTVSSRTRTTSSTSSSRAAACWRWRADRRRSRKGRWSRPGRRRAPVQRLRGAERPRRLRPLAIAEGSSRRVLDSRDGQAGLTPRPRSRLRSRAVPSRRRGRRRWHGWRAIQNWRSREHAERTRVPERGLEPPEPGAEDQSRPKLPGREVTSSDGHNRSRGVERGHRPHVPRMLRRVFAADGRARDCSTWAPSWPKLPLVGSGCLEPRTGTARPRRPCVLAQPEMNR